jgi:hypothetical protein
MNTAIRAQRERGNVPKSMLPPEDEAMPEEQEITPEVEPIPEPEPAAKQSFLARLLGRSS